MNRAFIILTGQEYRSNQNVKMITGIEKGEKGI